jgi:flagellar protein FliS
MKDIAKNTMQYMENTITSARPEDLTLMMYNGLLKFIARAREEIRAKTLEAAHNTLIRCQDIVFEFQYTLNPDIGLSNNLMLIYDYMYNRLIEANAKKDCGILDEIYGFAAELRDTWAEAAKISRDERSENGNADGGEKAEIGAVESEGTQSDTAESGAAQLASIQKHESRAKTIYKRNGWAGFDAKTAMIRNDANTMRLDDANPVRKDIANPKRLDVALPDTLSGSPLHLDATLADSPLHLDSALADSPLHLDSALADSPLHLDSALADSLSGSPPDIPRDFPGAAMPPAGIPMKLANPAAAAQYAKIAKSKSHSQEKISIASK